VAVLGLILLAAAGVLTAAVVTSNTDSLAVDLWGVTVSNVTLGVVFVAGMITTVLAVVGLGLLMGGLRRNRRLRKERKSLRRENEQLIQRVESTPGDGSPDHHTDRTLVDHDRTDRHRNEGQADYRSVDDRTPVDPGPHAGYDAPPSDGSTAAPQRRSFLPRRDNRDPEAVSRDV
jgi:uncharacterized membrane protein YcjF (UPF0283 family)